MRLAIRVVLGAVIPIALLSATLLSVVLPGEPIPSNSGTATGQTSASTAVLIATVLFTAVLAAGIALAVWRRRHGPGHALAIGTLAFLATTAALVSLQIAGVRSVAPAGAASDASWTAVVGSLIVASAADVIVGLLTNRLDALDGPDHPTDFPSSNRSVTPELRPGERAAWMGSCRPPWAAALAVIAGGAAAATLTRQPATGLVLLLVAGVGVLLSTIQVAAGPAGVSVT